MTWLETGIIVVSVVKCFGSHIGLLVRVGSKCLRGKCPRSFLDGNGYTDTGLYMVSVSPSRMLQNHQKLNAKFEKESNQSEQIMHSSDPLST